MTKLIVKHSRDSCSDELERIGANRDAFIRGRAQRLTSADTCLSGLPHMQVMPGNCGINIQPLKNADVTANRQTPRYPCTQCRTKSLTGGNETRFLKRDKGLRPAWIGRDLGRERS